MSRTIDEHFILQLYKLANQAGDIERVINRYDVGRAIGLHERGVDAICKLLLKANFIKLIGKDEVHLTSNGEQLALRLLHEKY